MVVSECPDIQRWKEAGQINEGSPESQKTHKKGTARLAGALISFSGSAEPFQSPKRWSECPYRSM